MWTWLDGRGFLKTKILQFGFLACCEQSTNCTGRVRVIGTRHNMGKQEVHLQLSAPHLKWFLSQTQPRPPPTVTLPADTAPDLEGRPAGS